MKKTKISIICGLIITAASMIHGEIPAQSENDFIFTVLADAKTIEYAAAQSGKTDELKETFLSLGITTLSEAMQDLIPIEAESFTPQKASQLVINDYVNAMSPASNSSDFSAEELQERWTVIFEQLKRNFEVLILANQDILAQIHDLIKNEFNIIKNIKFDSKCITVREEKFCTQQKPATEKAYKIKSISEIMPYINSLKTKSTSGENKFKGRTVEWVKKTPDARKIQWKDEPLNADLTATAETGKET